MTNPTPEPWSGPPPHELQGLLAERGVQARTRQQDDAPSAEVVVSWPDQLMKLRRYCTRIQNFTPSPSHQTGR